MRSFGRWEVLLAGASGLFGAASGEASVPSSPVSVWISEEADAAGGKVFVGHVVTDSALTLRYELVGEKRGQAGQSRVQQGGQVACERDKPARLSQVSFGRLGESDHYSIHLRVYDGVELRGETALDK